MSMRRGSTAGSVEDASGHAMVDVAPASADDHLRAILIVSATCLVYGQTNL
jgi:hypothetical protein